MSGEERTNQSGEMRLERIRSEHGVPVRRSPIAVGALIGGALGAWAANVPQQLLETVRGGLRLAANIAPADGAAAIQSTAVSVAAIAWPALACGLAGAVVGALIQTGFRVRSSLGASIAMRLPSGKAAGGAVARLSWALVLIGAAAWAVFAHWSNVAALPALPIAAAVASAARIVLDAVLAALAAGVVCAAADVAIARWKWERSTRMDDAEAREERRRTEGDPNTKSRRISQARSMRRGQRAKHETVTAASAARGKDLREQAA
jgi:flagellar biosynthesis protein FlhB